MKKVLVVSYFFPPMNVIGAKRYGIMCKYFRENGYDAYVLTGAKYNSTYNIKYDMDIPIPEENIIRVALENNKNLLSVINGMLVKLKRASRVINEISVWHKNVKQTVSLGQLKDIDIVIGTYSPMADLFVAKYIAKKLGCIYIADIRDFISDWKQVADGWRRTYWIDKILERKALHSTDVIITISPAMTKMFQKKYPGKKVVTVFNGWEGEPRESTGLPQEKYLYFAGTLYGYMVEDGLMLLLRALKKVNKKEKIKLIIRSTGPDGIIRKVKRIINQMGLEDIVSILPAVEEDIVREERSKSYINVVFSSIREEDTEFLAAMPGKSYDYIREKAPVLAIAYPKQDLAKLLSYTGKGIASVSEEEIADFILNLDPDNYVGNDNVLKFSRRYQAARLCKFMDYMLAKNERCKGKK